MDDKVTSRRQSCRRSALYHSSRKRFLPINQAIGGLNRGKLGDRGKAGTWKTIAMEPAWMGEAKWATGGIIDRQPLIIQSVSQQSYRSWTSPAPCCMASCSNWAWFRCACSPWNRPTGAGWLAGMVQKSDEAANALLARSVTSSRNINNAPGRIKKYLTNPLRQSSQNIAYIPP